MIPREHEPMLGAMAAAAERANRPTAMIVFSSALVALALLFAGVMARQASSARRGFVTEAVNTRQVGELADRIAQAQAALRTSTADTEIYAPSEALLSVLSTSATMSGFSKPPFFSTATEEAKESQLQRKVVTARMTGEEPAAIAAWIERAVGELPGLHVTQFSLKPTRLGWDVEIRFARWELKPR